MKLHELTDEYRELEVLLEAGEIDHQAFQDTAESIELSIEDKLVAMKKLKTSIDAEMAGIQAEIDRLTKLEKSKESQVKSIEFYAMQQMKKIGKSKFSTPIGDIKIQAGRKSLQVSLENLDEDGLARFVTTVLDQKIDKRAITAAINNGESIAGAELVIGDDILKM